MRGRRALPLVALAAGAAVVVLMVRAVGTGAVAAAARTVLPSVPLLLLPYAVQYMLEAAGWYFAFGAHKPSLGALRLFTLRMAGESINNVTPLGYVGGEPVKAMLLARHGVPAAQGIASVVVAKTLMTVAQALFVLGGLVAALALVPRHGSLAAGVLVLVAAVSLGLCVFLLMQRHGLFRVLLVVADALRIGRRIGPDRRARLREIDAVLSHFYRERRRDFLLCLSLYLCGWLAGVPEVLWMLRAMGRPVSLPQAFAIESLATVVKGAAFIVPGSVGAQEAGIVGLLSLFGHPAAVSVPFSLLRRAREILWIGFGFGCLAAHTRGAPPAA